jgi:hypothetical protein
MQCLISKHTTENTFKWQKHQIILQEHQHQIKFKERRHLNERVDEVEADDRNTAVFKVANIGDRVDSGRQINDVIRKAPETGTKRCQATLSWLVFIHEPSASASQTSQSKIRLYFSFSHVQQ